MSDLSSNVRDQYDLMVANERSNDWLLPDGVVDLLFATAQKQENLRFGLLSQLIRQGYQLVSPPLIEYTESLFVNASEDLKRQTFKIIDQLNGRMMGVRADITPQILRIDAQHGGSGVARYCYAGHVIHTLPSGLFGSRTPLQLGAEIFGSEAQAADVELLDVLMRLLNGLDLTASVHFDLGNVAIFQHLCALAELDEVSVERLMRLYDNKALPELAVFCQDLPLGSDFYNLARFGHDMKALIESFSSQVRENVAVFEAIYDAIYMVQSLQAHLQSHWQCEVSVDVTELSSYHYHTGFVFNVYIGQDSQALVRGGHFLGRHGNPNFNPNRHNKNHRPATGFSIDITRLLAYVQSPMAWVILVDFLDLQNSRLPNTPQYQAKADLFAQIEALRDQGHCVVVPLSLTDVPQNLTHTLRWQDGAWQLQALDDFSNQADQD